MSDPEWLRVTLRSIADAVVATDTSGFVSFMNAAAEELTGFTLGEAQGRPLEEVFRVVDETTRRAVENPAARALREGRVVGVANHSLLFDGEGTERAIEDSAAPIRRADGSIDGVVLVFRDVSERRHAERELRDSEQRYRALVEGTKDYAIFLLAPDGTVASWNAAAQRIKGWRADEIVGRHFSSFYPPEDVAAGWPDEELRRAAAAGRFEDEGWRVRKDGSQFWANVVITALRDDAGRLTGFSKITRDLTERRQAERAMRERQEQVHELERARATAEVLAEQDRRKDEFLAMLSHELRNPLAPMLNAVHLLESQSTGDDRQALAVIERQIGHLTRIVDDLLEVSRVTTGRVRLVRSLCDVRDIAGRAVESVRSQVGRRGVELRLGMPSEPLCVDGDPTRLEQVVVNLLTNAVKYTEADGRIDVVLAREDDEAVLRVRDTGMGIAPELLPHVFDLFTQSARTLDRAQGGLGVGLTIVRRLVEMHGGNVSAASSGVGRGSEFTVRLPLVTADACPADRAQRRSRAHSRPLRILVVDDNRDAADTSAMLLRNVGHDVRTEYSGGAVLAAAEQFRPDAILLDIGLPEIDGYELARRLRADNRFARTRLLAVSGYGLEGDRARSSQSGFDAHLVKPVDLRDVLELLQAA
jgi:PAS domain S-box-containing protein